MGCHFLLQRIFLTQGLNPGLPHCKQDALPSEPPGKSKKPYRYAIISHWVLIMSPKHHLMRLMWHLRHPKAAQKQEQWEWGPTRSLCYHWQHVCQSSGHWHNIIILILAELADNECLILIQLPHVLQVNKNIVIMKECERCHWEKSIAVPQYSQKICSRNITFPHGHQDLGSSSSLYEMA